MRRPRWGTLAAAAAASACLASAAACGGGGSGPSGGTAAATGSAQSRGGLKVGLVSDTGTPGDRATDRSARDGLQRAEKELGVQGRLISSRSAAGDVAGVRTLARAGYDLVIGVGPSTAGAIETVAAEFPDRDFAVVDHSVVGSTAPANVRGLTFATGESGYLAGYMAARMAARHGGARVVSAVGARDLPDATASVAGYEAGAKAADPGARVLVDQSPRSAAQGPCRTLALRQIAAGSRVVFAPAGRCGLGALAAAKDRGAWGIGADRDLSGLGPFILTSAVKRADVAVYDTIASARRGRLGGGDGAFDLENGGVALGAVSPKVPKAILDQVEGVRRRIVAGAIRPPATP